MSTTTLALSPQNKKQFAACLSTFLFNGALALSIGALLPFLREAYGLDYAFAGLLVSLHSVGNLVASFTAGLLPLAVGRRKSILLFTLCYSLSFLFMMLFSSHIMLAITFIMTGLARGAVSNFNNSAITEIAPGKAWALNTLHAAFAVGAFAAPFLVLGCTQWLGSWKIMCGIMIAFGVCELLIYAFMPIPNNRVVKSEKGNKNLGFLQEKQFWIGTGTLFFYLCAEQGVIGWMVTYFKDSGIMSAAYAQTMASILWILILAGRLTAAYLSSRMDKSRLLGLMGIGFVAFFVVVMLGRSLPVITLGIAGFGFSMAGIYPTTVSQCGAIIKKYPMAWSVILTTASFGSILMPSIVGAVAESAGIYMGMCTIVIAVVITLGFIAANLIMHRKQQQ